MAEIQNVTDATFEAEVLRSELPVLVDLYADWCAPCKKLAPILQELANELDGKAKFVKVDVDKNPRVSMSFRVQSIPTMFVIHQGQVAGTQQGLVPKAAILEMLAPLLPAEAGQVKPDELAMALSQGKAVAIDIRDARSYERTHVPGAVHIAEEDLSARARDLRPSDGRIRVLYGRTTDEAKRAAESLRESGVEVAFLEGGFLHWEADQLPVEKTSAAN